MSQLHFAFHRLELAIETLSEEDRNLAIETFSRLVDVIEQASATRNGLKQGIELKVIRSYITNKLNEAQSQENPKLESRVLLHHFRNELVHGKFNKKYSPSDIKRLGPFFWKVLEKSAQQWNPNELSNILAYCLHSNRKADESFNTDQKKIVRFYKTIFNALDEDRKTSAFIELTLRLLSEPAFRETLESMVN